MIPRSVRPRHAWGGMTAAVSPMCREVRRPVNRARTSEKKGLHCVQALEFGEEVELVSSGPAYSDKVQR